MRCRWRHQISIGASQLRSLCCYAGLPHEVTPKLSRKIVMLLRPAHIISAAAAAAAAAVDDRDIFGDSVVGRGIAPPLPDLILKHRFD